ncbi:MAG: aldo/keto reductase [Planctomycetaceae bacterium]|nr:aldo/keto reductase [Planctomycetaceae bacterium]
MTTEQRQLGTSDLRISSVALGCWPLAGITSGQMTDEAAVRVIASALDAGINHLDTAYAYGREGESERRIALALRGRRDRLVVATKVGVYWDDAGVLQLTADPALLRRHVEESLRRLAVDEVDLLYLHAPAPGASLADAAGLFRDLLQEGKTRAVGVSNLSVDQLAAFQAECPVVACQVRYNLLQREIEGDVLPWCRAQQVSVIAYEPLALGLLTGKFGPDHVFADEDWRRQSPLFTGEAWTQNLATVARLRPIAAKFGCSLAQLAVGWTISRAGVTAALCGAKEPDQIRETAQAMRLADALQAVEL